MSDKIKELATKAGIHLTRVGFLDGDRNGIARFVPHNNLKAFASLIAQETIRQLRVATKCDVIMDGEVPDVVNAVIHHSPNNR